MRRLGTVPGLLDAAGSETEAGGLLAGWLEPESVARKPARAKAATAARKVPDMIRPKAHRPDYRGQKFRPLKLKTPLATQGILKPASGKNPVLSMD
jgi:hypothetical protein